MTSAIGTGLQADVPPVSVMKLLKEVDKSISKSMKIFIDRTTLTLTKSSAELGQLRKKVGKFQIITNLKIKITDCRDSNSNST